MAPIPGEDSAVAAELLRVSRDSAKPVLATFQGHLGMHPDLLVGSVPSRGSIPSYAAPEEAVRALEYVVRYARWRARPSLPPPERVSLPDIDVDFCERRRVEVIEYVTAKYGRENVSQIITFGTMKA